MPQWKDERFSAKLTKDNTIVVDYRTINLQSFSDVVDKLQNVIE